MSHFWASCIHCTRLLDALQKVRNRDAARVRYEATHADRTGLYVNAVRLHENGVAYADVESEKQEIEDNRRKAEMKLQREIDARTAAEAPPKEDSPPPDEVVEAAPAVEAEAVAETAEAVSASSVGETEPTTSAESETTAQVAE